MTMAELPRELFDLGYLPGILQVAAVLSGQPLCKCSYCYPTVCKNNVTNYQETKKSSKRKCLSRHWTCQKRQKKNSQFICQRCWNTVTLLHTLNLLQFLVIVHNLLLQFVRLLWNNSKFWHIVFPMILFFIVPYFSCKKNWKERWFKLQGNLSGQIQILALKAWKVTGTSKVDLCCESFICMGWVWISLISTYKISG